MRRRLQYLLQNDRVSHALRIAKHGKKRRGGVVADIRDRLARGSGLRRKAAELMIERAFDVRADVLIDRALNLREAAGPLVKFATAQMLGYVLSDGAAKLRAVPLPFFFRRTEPRSGRQRFSRRRLFLLLGLLLLLTLRLGFRRRRLRLGPLRLLPALLRFHRLAGLAQKLLDFLERSPILPCVRVRRSIDLRFRPRLTFVERRDLIDEPNHKYDDRNDDFRPLSGS